MSLKGMARYKGQLLPPAECIGLLSILFKAVFAISRPFLVFSRNLSRIFFVPKSTKNKYDYR